MQHVEHKHLIADKVYPQYIPFNNKFKGKSAKTCFVKGWNQADFHNARTTIEECPSGSWIQRRLRVRDQHGNYLYLGYIDVDIDDLTWSKLVLQRIQSEKIKCAVRETKHGYHFIFRFVPSRMNSACSDYLYALNVDSPAEISKCKTQYVTDYSVDYKFSGYVKHIEDENGEYVGCCSSSGKDKEIIRPIIYEDKYSETEVIERNKCECLPSWYPAYDDIPEWLIPTNTNQLINENIMFKKETEDLLAMSDYWLCDDKKNIKFPFFVNAMNKVLTFKFAKNDFNIDERKIYIYENGVYSVVADEEIISFINNVLNLQGCGCKCSYRDSIDLFNRWKIQNCYDYLIMDYDLDADENLVNFQNGLLNLETGELLPHSPKYLSSIQIPCNWDATKDSSEPTVFMNYLKKLTDGLPDQEQMISMILQYCGACIANVPVYRTKGALIFKGKSNAGKSQIYQLMFNLLGNKNAIPSELRDLNVNRFSKVALYKKRLTGHADMPHDISIDSAAVFRNLTGGDIIYAEQKHKGVISFTYQGGMIYCCNNCPTFKDYDEALRNRLYIVPCENVVSSNEKDLHLQDKFREEYPAIVKLMLRELLKLKKNNWELYQGETIIAARDNYERDIDNVSEFIEMAVTVSDKDQTGIQKIGFWFDSYVEFSKRYKADKILTRKNFTKRFESMQKIERYKSRTNNGSYYYKGIYPTRECRELYTSFHS